MYMTTIFLHLTLMILASHAKVSCPQGLQANHLFESPTNIITSKAIPANTTTPIIFFNGLFNFLRLKNLGNGVEAYPNEAVDTFVPLGILGQRIYTLITGGVLCKNMYMLHKVRFLISSDAHGRSGSTINGKGAPLEAEIIYHNINYGTFENSLGYSDGILIVTFQLLVGPIPNPFFVPLHFLLSSGVIRKPGSEFILPSALIYLWFDEIFFTTQYYAFPGSYLDLSNGKNYPAVHIVPTLPLYNLSYTQFAAFKNILGQDGKPISTEQPLYPSGSRTFIIGNGFTQVLVPL